jgi:hypothetical protein
MEVVGAGAGVGLGAEARSTGDGAGVEIVGMDDETIERYPITLYTWQLYKIHSYGMLVYPGHAVHDYLGIYLPFSCRRHDESGPSRRQQTHRVFLRIPPGQRHQCRTMRLYQILSEAKPSHVVHFRGKGRLDPTSTPLHQRSVSSSSLERNG